MTDYTGRMPGSTTHERDSRSRLCRSRLFDDFSHCIAARLLTALLLLGSATQLLAEQRAVSVEPAGGLTERSLMQLLRWAARLSRLPLPEDQALPALVSLPPDALRRGVCPYDPSDCGSLVAAYRVSDGVILYRNTFDFGDALDRSYIVHELVHYLQHINAGDQINKDCDAIRDNERQAYIAQSRYLSRRGESFPIDEMMKLSYCPSPPPAASISAS